MRLLVVNAGSSSLKLRVVEDDDTVSSSIDLDADHGRVDDSALDDALDALGTVDAAGHRVVHGGTSFRAPVVVDGDVLATLDDLVALAPLHQPTALAMIRTLIERLPDVVNVACFDTAFHATLPTHVSTYPIPARWRDEFGVRRYGFHGLSHSWAARRAAELVARDVTELRIVTCHLGAGASLAAVRNGASVDTTMGFTPLDGLVMMTRPGSLDPGVVAWLVTQAGLRPDEVERDLYNSSGMQALAGTSDMRDVEDAGASSRCRRSSRARRLRAPAAGIDRGHGDHTRRPRRARLHRRHRRAQLARSRSAPPRDWASSASPSTRRSTRPPMATRTSRRLLHPCDPWS